MQASVAALHRHPIKGFTPEPVLSAELREGEPFPCDRLFAVENGPSGFDPEAPVFMRKQKFAVLAASARVASVRTRYDETRGWLEASAPGRPPFAANVHEQIGRDAFSAWLTPILADDGGGPYRLIEGRGYRFLDHPLGHVSILNLASVRDLEQRIGKPVDPLRFRANIQVEGWAPWVENAMTDTVFRIGEAELRGFKPIVRCAAPDVDPVTALRDMTITSDLHRLYGHLLCGLYAHVTAAGSVSVGDLVGESQSLAAQA